MATMTSPFLPGGAETKVSNAERRIFDKLKTGPCTSGWQVLHSVKVPNRRNPNNKKKRSKKQRWTAPREVDFVIMVPKKAIICLEVKGDTYEAKEGKWYRTNRSRMGSTKGGMEPPDRQAANAMDGFRQGLLDNLPARLHGKIRNLPLWYALAFTEMEWPEDTPVPDIPIWGPSIALDQQELCQALSSLADNVPKGNPDLLDGEMMQAIINTYFPEFKGRQILTTPAELKVIDRRLVELTREQHGALEMIQDSQGRVRNERVLFEGSAGTGKTMLAVELARRRSKAGDRVAVVCYSPVLGNWLRQQLPDIPAVGGLPAALFASARVPEEFIREYDNDLYDNDLLARPSAGQDVLFHHGTVALEMMEKNGRQWDYLIVDELQLFHHKTSLQLMNRGLKGGLKQGRWAMFGDFTFQDWLSSMLPGLDYFADGSQPGWIVQAKEYLGELCPGENGGKGWVECPPLKTNCRNTRNIARAAARIAGGDQPTVLASQVAGPEVGFRYWHDYTELSRLLAEEFGRLRESGVLPEQVTVVSWGEGTTDLHRSKVGPWRLWDVEQVRHQKALSPPGNGDWVSAYNVVPFSGMENDVIIYVTNIMSDGFEHAYASMSYVCMTRARGALIVLAHESAKGLLEPSSMKCQGL